MRTLMLQAPTSRHGAQIIRSAGEGAAMFSAPGHSDNGTLAPDISFSNLHTHSDSQLTISTVCQAKAIELGTNDRSIMDETNIRHYRTNDDYTKHMTVEKSQSKIDHSNVSLVNIDTTDNLDRLAIPINERYVQDRRKRPFHKSRKDKYREQEHSSDTLNNESEENEAYLFGSLRSGYSFKIESKWTEVYRRTMTIPLQRITILVLFLMAITGSFATPVTSRLGRSAGTEEKSVRGYLARFGYLTQGQPEVGNLLHGDSAQAQAYEDEFRIAIKTLQEFGGIPVTGELDESTLELMKRRRCGRPDRDPDYKENKRKKRFVVQGAKWQNTNLTWSLSSIRRPSQLDPHGTRSVLARALDVWEQASRLTFTEINSDDADIVVSFAKRYHDDAYPFDGRGSILAHAFFPGTGRGGDAHFDDDELWLLHPNDEDEEGTSLFAVAAHEFGHSLGLSHSSVKGALMYPWYQGIQPNFVLPEDDRNGIQQMYGPKEKRTWGRVPHYRPAETPVPTTSTTTTTTTTRRPYHKHHHDHHNGGHTNNKPSYTPYPRQPSKYPTYYPVRPSYPEQPSYPDKPNYPDRRHYNTSEDNPRRTNHHYPRPEPTTNPTTWRPRYPVTKSEYPNYPNYPRPNQPTDRYDYPKKKPYYPEKATPKPTSASDKPDTCDTSYDAVALIRGELFIFKSRYHWRIGANGRYTGYPLEITRMWPELPKNLTHVDAVYERPDRKIAIFVGKDLYLFDSQFLVRGYPQPLTSLGLPESLERIDGAMVWGHNGKTYFYSGTMYWKYDEEDGIVELDYPRDMSMWKGVGYNIDSVFQWKDGKTYFFKGKGYWKFNDLQMSVEHERPLLSAPYWMGCPGDRGSKRAKFRSYPAAPGSTLRSPSAADHQLKINSVLFVIILILSRFVT